MDAHYSFHRRRERLDRPRRKRPPPEPSGSVIVPGTTQHRTGIYPSKEVAAYLDSALDFEGRRPEDEAEEADFGAALLVLAKCDDLAPEVVRSVCMRGRITLAWGESVRHWDWREAAQMLCPDRAEDELDDRVVNMWLTRSWSILGFVLLSPAEQKKARRVHEESAAAYERLRAARPI